MVEELLLVVVVLVVVAERGDVVVVVDHHWNYSIQHWNKTETHPSPRQYYSRHCSRPHLMPLIEMMMMTMTMTMTTRRKTTALA